MTEYPPLPPVRDNRSDCPPYTLRQGRDYPTPPARTMLFAWPFALAELSAANTLQLAEMAMTRRMR